MPVTNEPFTGTESVGEATEALQSMLQWTDTITEGEFTPHERERIIAWCDDLRRKLYNVTKKYIE